MESLAGLADDNTAGLPLFALRPDELEKRLEALPPAQAELTQIQGFKAAAGEVMLLPGESGLRAALFGLGDGPVLHGFGAAALALPTASVWAIEPGAFDMEEAELGFLLGAYRYNALKQKKKPVALLAPERTSSRAKTIAAAVCLARDLINTPANLLGPTELAQAAEELGERFGAATTRISGAALAQRYPAMAAVGAGSERGAEAVLFAWKGSAAGEDAPLISLCGKGVCFDTGGYDLKPSAAMLRMKKDMGGAAILLGLAQAVMSLDLPVRLHLRAGCVENSISGHAMRPSDVLQTHAGLSVEVGNTDAEGRLVLCDLLSEAAQESPYWLIDAATLTGAARTALGPDLPALFCTDDAMAKTILEAGRFVNDPLWRLPLFEGYNSWLESPVADLSTVSAKPFAGAIVAALYLNHFIHKQTAWAHIDVYAWNDSSRPGRPEGGEAQSLRALLQAIETLSSHSVSEP